MEVWIWIRVRHGSLGLDSRFNILDDIQSGEKGGVPKAVTELRKILTGRMAEQSPPRGPTATRKVPRFGVNYRLHEGVQGVDRIFVVNNVGQSRMAPGEDIQMVNCFCAARRPWA